MTQITFLTKYAKSFLKSIKYPLLMVMVLVMAITPSLLNSTANAKPVTPDIPPYPSFPKYDAFYTPPPSSYVNLKPGDIISSRPVSLANFSIFPIDAKAWQVSFRSTDSLGKPIVGVTTVIKSDEQKNLNERPLLTYDFAEDSLQGFCSPSFTLQDGSFPSILTGSILVTAQFLEVEAALFQGWNINMPDYQGIDNAFAAGVQGGHITLDSIKASENFKPLALHGPSTKVGMWGYSGGAIGVVHAAQMAKTYAPGLNIIGTAVGGVAANYEELFKKNMKSFTSGLVFMGIEGLAKEYPNFDKYFQSVLTPKGKTFLNGYRDLPVCLAWSFLAGGFQNLSDYITVKNPFAAPAVQTVMNKVNMGQQVPDMPMYIYESVHDEIMPLQPVNDLVAKYCSVNPKPNITYIQDGTSEHISLDLIGSPSVIWWFKNIFNNQATPGNCKPTYEPTMLNNPKIWNEILGGGFKRLYRNQVERTYQNAKDGQ